MPPCPPAGPRARGALLPLLLLLLPPPPPARADLKVWVPPSPLRASPFSDRWLPCNFSDPSRAIALRGLSVAWKIGEEVIAEYLDGATVGLVMTEERLLAGDASILLSGLTEADSGLYTCRVFMTPEKHQSSFELRVEAEPHIDLGSTKMQLASAGGVTCTVSGFYPSNVSVDWLKNGAVVKGPQTSVHQASKTHLYSASSTLKLTPSAADANANFSCRVTHQSLEAPLRKDFQLQLQALPSLQISTVEVLECLVCGFYPQDVEIHWLQNGMPQVPIQSQPQRLPNGTFCMHSMARAVQMGRGGVNYTCHVRHEAWDNPLVMTTLWRPKDEGEGVACPTPKRPQSSGTEGTPRACSPTPVPTPSATGTVPMWPWIVFALGAMLSVTGGIMLYLASKKGNSKLSPGTESNPESAEGLLKPQNNAASASSSL